ncbi:MAG: phosphatase PAP2 family protein [Bacteroidota bacterium]
MSDLLQFDEQLFQAINLGCQNAFFDWLMPLLRNKYVWFPAYLFLFSFLLVNFKKKGLLLVLAFAAVVSVSDFTSSQLFKKNIGRLRPCKVFEQPAEIHLLVPCGSGYSFPSSHASNHFAMAVFLCLTLGKTYRRIRLPLLVWAAAVAFAQVYVGVHFPLDVVAGGVWGAGIGGIAYLLTRQFYAELN